jgi:hypothetical protein
MRALLQIFLIASAVFSVATANAQMVRCDDRVYREARDCPGARKPSTVTNIDARTTPKEIAPAPRLYEPPPGSLGAFFGAVMNIKRENAIKAQKQASTDGNKKRDGASNMQNRAAADAILDNSRPPTTCQIIGGNRICNDTSGGTSTAIRIGGNTFVNRSDGSSSTVSGIGGTAFQNNSDGSSATANTIGGTTFINRSDGSSSTVSRIGGTTFQTNSDGTTRTCNSIGNAVVCN